MNKNIEERTGGRAETMNTDDEMRVLHQHSCGLQRGLQREWKTNTM